MSTIVKKDTHLEDELCNQNLPDNSGHFGEYGGRFVPETLIPALEQLEKEYLERLYMAGLPTVFKVGEKSFEGLIRGVNEYGELMVEHKGEIRTFGHGAIRMELNKGPV